MYTAQYKVFVYMIMYSSLYISAVLPAAAWFAPGVRSCPWMGPVHR